VQVATRVQQPILCIGSESHVALLLLFYSSQAVHDKMEYGAEYQTKRTNSGGSSPTAVRALHVPESYPFRALRRPPGF